MKQILLASASFFLCAATAQGESLVALTATNQLVRFDSATPGTVTTTAITGLLAGDMLVGIDVRPANNVLYGFAVDSGTGGANAGVGRIYSINTTSGAATQSSILSADPADTTSPNPFTAVDGAFFGVDFNPVVDRLRVVSDTGQNLRINVTNGLTQFDVPLAYAGTDANAGAPPMIVASAYSNSVAGAATTSLYALDASLNSLDVQTPANGGVLITLAMVDIGITADASFDISGATGTGYVVLDGLTLGTLNPFNGVVTEVGPIGTVGSIVGLTVIAVPEPSPFVLVSTALSAGWLAKRRVRRVANTSFE